MHHFCTPERKGSETKSQFLEKTQIHTQIPFTEDMTSFAEGAQPFVCGGTSAMFASFVIHPIDLTKVRMQLLTPVNGKVPSPWSVFMNVAKTEGIKGIYAGLSASLTRQATYGTARIGLHRVVSNQFKALNGGESIPFYLKALSGSLSGAMAVCVGTPFDVSLVRMQNDGAKPAAERRGYTGVFNALLRIVKEEGVLSLWKGLTPNILRGISMNVGMMACYDQAKEMIQIFTKDPDPKVPSLNTKLGSAAAAGFCCAFFSLPFDMVKSRLMNQKVDVETGKFPYKGVLDCGVKIARHEGVLAFWRGFSAYYFRCAPHAMVILLSIESVTHAYRSAFNIE